MAIFWLRYQGSRIALRKGETVVGRSPYCSVVVNSRRVSRQHCALSVNDNRLSICDLGSSNGTWVNGQPVSEPTRLNDGDLIEIGDEALEVEASIQNVLRESQATHRDLPVYHREFEEDSDMTTVTHGQASSVALIESLVANGSGVRSPTQHFDKVQRAVEQYLQRSPQLGAGNGQPDLERLRRSIEATVRLDASSEASDWRQRILDQLSGAPPESQQQQ